jgi:MYXO-CTERM domain-containing protein
MLTDGRVLSHGKNPAGGSSQLNNWTVLTPDKTGSYANGTWSSVASSAYARGGAQEHVLRDGRFFEAGGEYIYIEPGCTANCTQPASGSPLFKTAEIFDPIANTWTVQTPAPYEIADTGSAVLADGRILDSSRTSNHIQIFDPAAGTWTDSGTMPLGSGDENAWVALQNGGILAVGYSKAGAAVYDPASNKWTKCTMPAGFNTGDTAGISMMFDGRVIAYGIGTTYLYTPGATATDAGTWAVGPAMIKTAGETGSGDEAEDEFTDTLPNGKVWVGLTEVMFGPGVALQEFDPTTNTVALVTPPPDKGNPYPIGYLNLPNGQVMVTAASRNYLYTLDTQPDDSWRPVVDSVVFDTGTTYTLSGTQITGLINGADEGDDMTMGQNYPIVWLTDTSGNVYYCRSFNFSQMTPSKGAKVETCDFTTPAGLPNGTYSLYVSAVGVQSKNPVSFTTGMGGVGMGTGGAAGAAGTAGTAGTAGAGTAGTAGAGTAGAAGSATGGVAGTGGVTGGAGSTAGGATSGGTGTTTGGATTGGTGTSTGGTATAGSSNGGTSTGTAGDSSIGGASAGDTGTAAPGSAYSHDSPGCGCRVSGAPVSRATWAGFGLLGLALLRRKRRRQS